MRAIVFAAGRGNRMRPLSDTTAKPLLAAGGKRLIEWQIQALARAGIGEIVINLAHLSRQFEPALGDGARYGVRLHYSVEGETADAALETAGGIRQALAQLSPDGAPFIAVSGDIVTDFDYASLRDAAAEIVDGAVDAHLVLTDNPPFHPVGDMGLRPGPSASRLPLATRTPPLLNYGNIAVFAPRLFSDLALARLRLFPWLYRWVDAERVSAQHYRGLWLNIGTPADLAAADRQLKHRTRIGQP